MDTNALLVDSIMSSPMEVTAETQPSYISVLPDDILLYIFHTTAHNIAAPALAPVILSHVSPRWRTLALYAPTLWTYIFVVEVLGTSTVEFEKTLFRVPHFLERSRSLPLTINIIIRTYHPDFTMQDELHPFASSIMAFRNHTRHLSSLLGLHAGRFRHFTLVTDEFDSVQDVQSSLPHSPMPLLESFRVWQRDDFQCLDGDLDDPSHLEALSLPLRPHGMVAEQSTMMYPKLAQITLKGIPMVWHRFCPSNLQYLHIGFLPMEARPSGEDLRRILLANEHSLEALKIQGATPLTFSDEPYVMSRLKSLEIGFAYPEEAIPIIQSMRAPNLVSLAITDLQRSFASVDRRKSLDYDIIIIALFEEILAHVPLHQIVQCSLSHICFFPFLNDLPDYAPLIELATDSAIPDYPIPATLLGFFSRMTSLRYLVITDPDPSTLRCLNYIKPTTINSADQDDAVLQTLLPALSHLHLLDFHLPLAQAFIFQRLAHPTSFSPLDNLLFSMPIAWIDHFGPFLPVVAENVEVLDTPYDDETERFLLLALPQ